MEKYIEALRDFCKRNPLDHGDADSVMELLYWFYTENNPVDNQKIRDGFAKLRSQFPCISLQEFDPVYMTVSDLCMEHERLAFYEGLRLGTAIMMELYGQERSGIAQDTT